MDISFTCDKCGQNIVVDGAGAGLATECPKCGQPITVPSQELPRGEPLATKQCPYCAETIKKEASVCRFCGRELLKGKPTPRPPSILWVVGIVAIVILGLGVLGTGLWYHQKAEQVKAEQATAANEIEKTRAEKQLAELKRAEDKRKLEAERQLAELKQAEDKKNAEIEAAIAEAARKQAESYARIAVAAKTAMSKINEIGSAINAGVNYTVYAQKVIEIAAPIDELAGVVATETKVYPNADAKELVRLTLIVLANHKEARDLWNYEIYGGSTDPDLLAAELTDVPEVIYQDKLKWINKQKNAALKRLDIWEQAFSNAVNASKVFESMTRASDH